MDRFRLLGLKSNRRMGCIATLFVILALCSSSFLILHAYREKKIRQDPDRLARAFARALETRDLEEALSLVTPEKERDVKLLLKDKEEINCGFSWEGIRESLDDGFYRFGLTSEDETTRYYFYESSGTFTTRSEWHYFYIQDTTVERNGDEWIVVDWGEIQEYGP